MKKTTATMTLILLNVAVFFFFLLSGKSPVPWVLYPESFLVGNLKPLITSGFLHGSLLHLAMNMLGIFVFGRIVERHLGAPKTFFIYFGALLLSMAFAMLIYIFVIHKDVAIIGASGAVMGLIAAAMLLDPFAITYEMILPLPVMVKGWLFFYADIMGFLGGERDGISHVAHLCGFLSIAFLVYFLSPGEKKLMRYGLAANVFSFIGFLAVRLVFFSGP